MALTVDHGLRPESAEEAHHVKTWLVSHGIVHHTLPWIGPKPTTAIQETARNKRLELLSQWCQDHDVLHLFLAHHQQDVVETFLMRLSRFSGISGLTGIPPLSLSRSARGSLRILRPLLSCPKERLMATLKQWGQPYIQDPSNHNLGFERARWRLFMELVGPHPLRESAVSIIQGLQTLHEATQKQSVHWLAQYLTLSSAGVACLPLAPVLDLPANILADVLKRILTTVSGQCYGPNQRQLDRLCQAFTQQQFNHTLLKCRLLRSPNCLWIGREWRSVASPVHLPSYGSVTWDERFHVVNNSGRAFWIQAAGHIPIAFQIPGVLRHVLPSLWSASMPSNAPSECLAIHDGSPESKTRWHHHGVSLLFQPTRSLTQWGHLA